MMTQEQQSKLSKYYIDLYDDQDKTGKEASKMIFNLRTKNIEHLRSFWFNLIILSSAILVAILPLLVKNPEYFQNKLLAIIGLVFLVIMDIIGCFYINVMLSRENRHLSDLNNFHENKSNEGKKIINKIVEEKKEFKEGSDIYLKFLEKVSAEESNLLKRQALKGFSDWFNKNFSDIITTLLILGVAFVALSFIPIQCCGQEKMYNDNIFYNIINMQTSYFCR